MNLETIKNRIKKLPKLRKKTKKTAVVLTLAFCAITAGLTISSAVINRDSGIKPYNGLHDDTELNSSLKTVLVNAEEGIDSITDNAVTVDRVGTSSYIVSYGSNEDAVQAVESFNEQSIPANMDFVFHVTEDEIEQTENTETTTVSESSEVVYEKYEEEIASGKTLRQIADETGKKLVAVIDTGINDYCSAVMNFTNDGDNDFNGHGTNMAKLIIENSDENVIILSLKAIGDDGTGTMSQVYQALQYAKEQDVDIVNMSISAFDNGENELFKEMLEGMINDGIQIVASAGNYSGDVENYIPANIDGVITVGSEYGSGVKTDFSNSGEVDYYVTSSSTSEAAAIITGKLAGGGV